MIHGHIKVPGTFTRELLDHPVWREAFGWLRQTDTLKLPPGTYPIAGDDIQALVQHIPLKPAHALHSFEAHRQKIDLQFSLTGKEVIQFAPVPMLLISQSYSAKKDYELYKPPTSPSMLMMNPGMFAIFYPEDAHMPGISFAGAEATRKVVIKIDKGLFERKPVVIGPYECVFDYLHGVNETLTLFTSPLLAPAQQRFDSINWHGVQGILRGSLSSEESKNDVLRKHVFLVNFGRSVHNNDVSTELAELEYRSVDPEWLLALHRAQPRLMDDHIILSVHKPWHGPEDAPECLCLHNDSGIRRLRTHFANTTWGPHIWFAVEAIT